MIHNTIVSAPEELRDTLRRMTRMSGKTIRHRLNRGGDGRRTALHIIAIGHLLTNDRTKAYVARRIADGHSKLEASLKRYIAREVFTLHRSRRGEINQTQFAA